MRFLLSHRFSLLAGLAFSLIGIFLIVRQHSLGWLVLVFGIVIAGFNGLEIANETRREKLARQSKRKATARREQFERWVTQHSPVAPQNPVDVWAALLADNAVEWALFDEGIPVLADEGIAVRRAAPPIDPAASWVVFEQGTLVVCEPGQPAADSARDILSRTDLTLLDEDDPEYDVQLAPNLGVWIVSYPGKRLFSFTRLRDDIRGSAAMSGSAWEALKLDWTDKRIVHTQTAGSPSHEK